MIKFTLYSLVWWHTPVILDPGRLRQDNLEFEVSLGYIERRCLKTKQISQKQKERINGKKEEGRERDGRKKGRVKQRKKGYWHISVSPSLGQDEFGGENQDDYLCALFSAKYCFKKAIEYGLDVDGKYSEIVENLSFPLLKNGMGFFASSGEVEKSALGKQKHPVQLNDLAFLPVDTVLHEESVNAYRMRYDITGGAKQCLFPGWTLGEFLLAGSRVGDVDGWMEDFTKLYSCSDLTDKENIQIYESYGNYAAAYYTTSNGLVLQSLLNNVLSDWLGEIVLGGCKIWKGKVVLNNIYSLQGVKISGDIIGDAANVCIEALRDCSLVINGKDCILGKGEKRKMKLNLASN